MKINDGLVEKWTVAQKPVSENSIKGGKTWWFRLSNINWQSTKFFLCSRTEAKEAGKVAYYHSEVEQALNDVEKYPNDY